MSDDRVIALIKTHLARYPQAEIPDVYKLLHQATFGPGHLITNRRVERDWLERRMEQLAPSGDEPLVENIHPDGLVVRVHLRPYLVYNSKSRPLMDALVRSAEQVQGDPATMAARWTVFETMVRSDAAYAARFSRQEIDIFEQVRTHEHWPAVHHSPAYHAAYCPDYRVLTRDEAEALCGKINAPFEVI
ncbi:MAG: hypothetical protein JXJ20_10790 [Anaerolineae bacterium]|nr:hypothetical protein [Anaerolineae bacterium]